MVPSRDLFAAQAELSQEGAALIASNLDERLSVMLRTDGRRQIVLRLKETFGVFPLEWFRGFRVTILLAQLPGANEAEAEEIAYSISEVEYVKGKRLYFLTLAPISEGDRTLSEGEIAGNTVPANIARVELTAGEVELAYTHHEPSGLFVLGQRPQAEN